MEAQPASLYSSTLEPGGGPKQLALVSRWRGGGAGQSRGRGSVEGPLEGRRGAAKGGDGPPLCGGVRCLSKTLNVTRVRPNATERRFIVLVLGDEGGGQRMLRTTVVDGPLEPRR